MRLTNAAFTATIATGNAAFGEDAAERDDEVSRIVDRILAKLADGHTEGAVMDTNGNTVGTWRAR